MWVPCYLARGYIRYVCDHVCVIKPCSSENTLTESCFVLVRVGNIHVWAPGAAAISEWSAVQWKNKTHTSVGWYSSQVAQELQTCLILQTQLVFSYSPSLSLSISVTLLFSAILYVNIYFTLCLPLFLRSHLFSLSFLLKFTAVPEFSRWGKIPEGRRRNLQCLCGQLKNVSSFLCPEKKNSASLCALFVFIESSSSWRRGQCKRNASQSFGGKRSDHLHTFASY